MPTRIAGVALRAGNKHTTAEFYEKLGLAPHEHQHGGPKHYEVLPLSPTIVVEIYQSSTNYPTDTIMLEVDSIDAALFVAASFNIEKKSEIKETPDGRLVYITDPDGRAVMLIENRA